MRLLLGLCLAASIAAASDADITKMEKTWANAVVKQDYAALEKLYTPDLIYAHSTGAIEDRSEYMNRLKSGKQKYDSIDIEKTKVAEHGNTAVAHSILRMTGTSNGEHFDNKVMALHVWVKEGGSWKLAAHQTTRLP